MRLSAKLSCACSNVLRKRKWIGSYTPITEKYAQFGRQMNSVGGMCPGSIKNTSDSGTEQKRSFLINNYTILSHETAHIMLSQAHRLAVELWCLLTIQSIITSLRIKC